VLPQIPEAIGRAILRTEAALNAAIDAAQPHSPDASDERSHRS
jgi:DNA (cytosine-5)-methyltransferase 1